MAKELATTVKITPRDLSAPIIDNTLLGIARGISGGLQGGIQAFGTVSRIRQQRERSDRERKLGEIKLSREREKRRDELLNNLFKSAETSLTPEAFQQGLARLSQEMVSVGGDPIPEGTRIERDPITGLTTLFTPGAAEEGFPEEHFIVKTGDTFEKTFRGLVPDRKTSLFLKEIENIRRASPDDLSQETLEAVAKITNPELFNNLEQLGSLSALGGGKKRGISNAKSKRKDALLVISTSMKVNDSLIKNLRETQKAFIALDSDLGNQKATETQDEIDKIQRANEAAGRFLTTEDPDDATVFFELQNIPKDAPTRKNFSKIFKPSQVKKVAEEVPEPVTLTSGTEAFDPGFVQQQTAQQPISQPQEGALPQIQPSERPRELPQAEAQIQPTQGISAGAQADFGPLNNETDAVSFSEEAQGATIDQIEAAIVEEQEQINQFQGTSQSRESIKRNKLSPLSFSSKASTKLNSAIIPKENERVKSRDIPNIDDTTSSPARTAIKGKMNESSGKGEAVEYIASRAGRITLAVLGPQATKNDINALYKRIFDGLNLSTLARPERGTEILVGDEKPSADRLKTPNPILIPNSGLTDDEIAKSISNQLQLGVR